MSHATESWYPLQYRLSADRLRNMRTFTDAIRAAGGRTGIYTNPLMLSRATRDYELWARDMATIDSRGRVQLTEHYTRHHPMSLPYPNAAWAARFVQAMEGAVLAGRPDLLYLEQLGAVPAHLDFAPETHGHRHFGEWTRGSVEFVRTVAASLLPRHPDLGTFIECPNPALLQYVNLSFYGTNRILRYIFPTYYGFVGWVDPVSGAETLEVAREALLTGEPATIHSASLARATEHEQQAVREVIALKRMTDELLRQARFRDRQGLTISPGVRATLLVGADVAYVPFVNPDRRDDARVTLAPQAVPIPLGEAARVWVVGSDKPLHVTASNRPGGELSLVLPAAPAGIVEFR